MPLSERQLRSLSVLEWLYDPDLRAEGRTTALAVAAIRVACANPRAPISIFDHSGTSVGRRNLFVRIRDLLQMDAQVAPFVVFNETTLTLNLPRPILGWLPPETAFSDSEVRALGLAAGERLARMRREARREEEVLPNPESSQMTELLAFNSMISQRMAEILLPERMVAGTPARAQESLRDYRTARASRLAAQQTESVREDFEAFHGGMAIPFPEAETISQEAADRIAEERQETRRDIAATFKATPKKVVDKPVPKSVWDRLLKDED